MSEEMAHHFDAATRARDALVRGDLTAAQAAMSEVAVPDSAPDVPALHAPYAESMRRAAATVSEARDLDAATAAFGNAAVACGACHLGVGAEVAMSDVAPPAGDELAAQMRRHLWALDRMWEGLVVPDAARFSAGAAGLAEVPLGPLVGRAGTVDEHLRALWDRAHDLGADASLTTDDATRARVYGELLRTCADCHRRSGVGGPLAPIPL